MGSTTSAASIAFNEAGPEQGRSPGPVAATLPTPKAHDWRRRTIASACERVSSNVRPAVSTTCAVSHGS